MTAFHLDTFSGAAGDLPKGRRTLEYLLPVLARAPRVSVWDMSEYQWLRSLIADAERAGLIASDDAEPYPWHRYDLTPAGRELANKAGR